MGRIVTYYCDRCGLTIPKDKGALIFNLTVEHYTGDYAIIDKLICEKCLNDLKDRWMLDYQEGGDQDE